MDSFIHILIPAGSHFTHNTLVYLPCFEIASNKLHIMCRISSFFKLLQYSVDMGCLCKSPMFKKKNPRSFRPHCLVADATVTTSKRIHNSTCRELPTSPDACVTVGGCVGGGGYLPRTAWTLVGDLHSNGC